ncbi:hypothetical protein DNTS_008328 [Danionella cerebrum]|uniref:Granulocyte colony-stimulating factor n=1 Tax=Danionella cerebrum TaxID=2873325 RepID=A0A553R0T7_9TELE|nr:hypothetical protein DNTS_008328 [Danionella translucida]
MHFQAALFFTLVGTLLSAPVSQKLKGMDSKTIGEAQSLISKILQEIPETHAAWITSKSLTLGGSTDSLQFLKSMIPSAPILPNITEISSLETGLVNMSTGLQLHLNLLNKLSEATSLPKTEQVTELQADIEELLEILDKLQIKAGFNASKEHSHGPEQDLVKNLTSEYKTQAAAHLTLHQLQEFSREVLQRIRDILLMTSGTVN